MKKRLLAALCLIALLATGCAQEATPQTTTPGETTQPAAQIEYRCPWEYDVCQQAKETGTMHYYFMCSEGAVTADGAPAKWGDSCLIVFPNGQTMLIDCGVTAFGPILVENLKRMGVTRLDYIVVTHPHHDHQNGVFHQDNLNGDGVLDQFEIGQVYHRGDTDPKKDSAQRVETVCTQRGLALDVLEMGDVLQIGDISAKVLWPKPGTSQKKITGTANANNSSIVIRFDYGEHSSLFTGDLYDDGEMALLSAVDSADVDVDLLKAPHHGGYTSSSVMFLKMVSAELTVATGFVAIRDDVASRYTQTETPILDDVTYGYIHVFTDGKTMTWETSREAPLPIPAAPIA